MVEGELSDVWAIWEVNPTVLLEIAENQNKYLAT